MNAPKYWPYVVIALVVFPAGILYGRHIYAPCDDAYIFLVYARNLVNGNGLTFNGTTVEGFTSVVWVVLLSTLGLARAPLPLLAETLSTLAGLLALFATYVLARRLNIDTRWALVAPILLVATGDFTFYMSVGLEEALFAALVALCVASAYSQEPTRILGSYSFPLLMALTVLTRPEGALVSVLLLAVLGLRSKSVLLPIRCGAVLALMLAPVLVSKWAYYGYPLPNTYYAKSNAGLSNLSQGIAYISKSFYRYGIAAITAMSLLIHSLRKRKLQFLQELWPLGLILIAWVLYVTSQGGDNMVGGRVLLPILPLAYVGLVRLAVSGTTEGRILVAGTALLCLSLVLGYLFDPYVARHADSWRKSFVIRRDAGIYLQQTFPPSTLVALNPAGIIPYYSQLPTIDMLGLNDVYIAHYGKRDRSLPYGHQAGDGLYVLSRCPDIVLFGGIRNEFPGPYLSDQEIWESPQFHSHYRRVEWSGIGFAYVKKE